jgi:hypothetical protein
MGVYCGNFTSDDTRAFMSVVYAYSKRVLYTTPSSKQLRVYAATYLAPTSWYRSVPPSGQALVENSFKPFNSYIQPARPQDIDDVSQPPMLVMKVCDSSFCILTTGLGSVLRIEAQLRILFEWLVLVIAAEHLHNLVRHT